MRVEGPGMTQGAEREVRRAEMNRKCFGTCFGTAGEM
jgi:hypothetical protein